MTKDPTILDVLEKLGEHKLRAEARETRIAELEAENARLRGIVEFWAKRDLAQPPKGDLEDRMRELLGWHPNDAIPSPEFVGAIVAFAASVRREAEAATQEWAALFVQGWMSSKEGDELVAAIRAGKPPNIQRRFR